MKRKTAIKKLVEMKKVTTHDVISIGVQTTEPDYSKGLMPVKDKKKL